jgi:DNA primase
LQVKVLQIQGAKDPDEFLKKFGPDKFKLLLEGSSNRVEYQLNAIAQKYDLGLDDQRIKFIQESAQLISTLGSAVQREVYGHRVAEAGKISYEAMKTEIDKAFKRRVAQEKKKQEKISLEPARARQPESRSIRYDNIKSAMAEETVIALALRDPSLLDKAAGLCGDNFSVPLLGRVYDQLQERHSRGLEVSLGVLAEMGADEMSHLTGICQRQQGPVNETAFKDCVNTIRGATQSKNISSDDDLLAFRNKLKERKGTK